MPETLSMKETVERAMQNLPEENTIDVAMERLLLLANIEIGLQDVLDGKVHTQEEVEALFEQW
jgi:predicted transcriptional regulator